MKKFISLFIALVIAISVFAVPVSAESVISKTMMQYKDINLSFDKAEDVNYDCKVENNGDGYVKVDAYNEGDHYWLTVKSEKPTKSGKPVGITVTKQSDGSVYKKYSVTVTAAKKVKMKNVKFNKGTKLDVKVKNPYIKEYKLSYNKKIVKVTSIFGAGNYYTYTMQGLKKGTTTVKAKIKGKLIGSFKVTVGNYKAAVKKSYKKNTLKYNKHFNCYCFYEGGSVDLADALKFYRYDSKYTVKIKNKKVAKARKIKKDSYYKKPERVEVYAIKPGKTEVTVYEKRPNAKKKTKVGTFTVKTKTTKDSEVFGANMEYDNDGLFYEYFVSPGDVTNFTQRVIDKYINLSWTGSHFDESEYKFTYTASPSNVITVNEQGDYKILDYGSNKAGYTVTFADGSKVSLSGSFDIMPEDSY